VYLLEEPDTGEVRYVGKAVCPEHRLYEHLNEAMNSADKACKRIMWLRAILGAGKSPVMRVIDEVMPEDAAGRELFWIKHFLAAGVVLLNERYQGLKKGKRK
jgi:hypothetical protein